MGHKRVGKGAYQMRNLAKREEQAPCPRLRRRDVLACGLVRAARHARGHGARSDRGGVRSRGSRLCPPLYGAPSQEVGLWHVRELLLLSFCLLSFFVRPRRFFVPTYEAAGAPRCSRSQGWPSRGRCHGFGACRPRLDGGKPGATMTRSRRRGSRHGRQDVILDWAERHMRRPPHNLVSGPDRRRRRWSNTLILHARVKARPRQDGTLLRKRCEHPGWARSHVCPGSRRPS